MGITLESEMFPYGVIGVASRGSFKRLVIQKQHHDDSPERAQPVIVVYLSTTAGAGPFCISGSWHA